MCTSYAFFQLRFVTSFSTFLILIFSGGDVKSSTHQPCEFLDHCSAVKMFLHPNTEDICCFHLFSSEFCCSFIYFLLALAQHFTSCLIPPRISFSNISIKSMFLSKSIINLSKLILSALLILVLLQNQPDLICSVLSMYFRTSQIHLATVKHLFSSK